MSALPTQPAPSSSGDHITITAEEYRRLKRLEAEHKALERAGTKLNNPDTKWVGAEDAAARFAGSRLKRARAERGLSQAQLAQEVGVDQSTISRIESDPDRSTLAQLRAVAQALGIDISDLIA